MSTDYPPFDDLCYALASLFLLFAAGAVFQLGRIVERDEGAYLSASCVWPVTVQQQVHLVVFLLCSVRAAFFFVAVEAWDPIDGLLVKDKVAFYSLDEFATVLFFTLTSVLALFWAELYYISTDMAVVFSNVVKPVTYVVNAAAFVGVAIITYLVSTYYEDDVDYIFLDYTILVATVYLMAALMFGYYAYAAAMELKEAPIQLSARRSRLWVLRFLAIICIMALVIKAAILIYITGMSIPTTSDEALSLVFLYYFFLELFPLAVVLIFYRIETPELGEKGEGGADYDDPESHEAEPLNRRSQGGGGGNGVGGSGGGGGGGSVIGSNASGVSGTSITSKGSSSSSNRKIGVSPIRTMPKYGNRSAPTDVIDSIIARLSADSHSDGGGSHHTSIGFDNAAAGSEVSSTRGSELHHLSNANEKRG